MSRPPRHGRNDLHNPDPPSSGPPLYDGWTDRQLMEEVRSRGITGFESMSHEQLLHALEAPDTQRSVHESNRREGEAV